MILLVLFLDGLLIFSIIFGFEFIVLHLILLQIFISFSTILISILGIREKIKSSRFLFLLAIVSLLLASLIITPTCCNKKIILNYSQAVRSCTLQLNITCEISNSVPPSYYYPIYILKENNTLVSCFEILNCSSCEECIY